MIETPLLDRLDELQFPEAKWGKEDRPVLIADGNVMHVRELGSIVQADAAYAVGLRQRDFDRLTEVLRTTKLRFYDMPVEDITSLGRVGSLRSLMIEWNTKLLSLAALASLTDLTTLSIVDTPKVKDLTPLAALTKLRALEYSGGIWNKNTAESLEPVGRLPALEELQLSNIRVLSGGVRPLANCRALRRLAVSNHFPTEDFAYLSVALPDTDCWLFAPYVPIDTPAEDDADVMVVGSRKPFLNSKKDAARLQRYEDDFRRLQDQAAAET